MSKGKNSKRFEPLHEISNNLVYATSKPSDQPAHTRSLIRASASRLNIGAVCSGSTLFASILNLSVMLGNYLQQTTSADEC